MVATATRKLVGGRFMAMTTGPDRVYAGRGDRGHRGDNGVHRRGSPGEYRSRAADRTGEYQRGNRCHAECRRPR